MSDSVFVTEVNEFIHFMQVAFSRASAVASLEDAT